LDRPFDFFGFTFSLFIVVPVFLFVWISVGWALKKAVFAWVHRFTSRTATQLDDILLGAADFPVTIMVVVWGFAALAHFVGPDYAGRGVRWITVGSQVATLVAVVLFIDRALMRGLTVAGKKHDLVRFTQGVGSVLVHSIVYVIGILVLLDSFGVSITPVIASLGLGSLAVALALQPTLENFISGFQLLVDQPLKIGNYVKLESGEEGFVEKVGWRSTWVRQGVNNMIILPNKSLVNARLLNYDYPSPETIIPVPMSVHYTSDLAKVERVVVEVATEVLRSSQGAVEFAPVVRFTKFDASGINFVAVLKSKTFLDGNLLTHDFIKAISSRFARENIVMPYPIVAINTAQETAVFNPSQS
jgi:small-conductance mechanosensitive channel